MSRVVSALRGEASAGDNALDKPQTLRIEDAIEPLQSLRDVVCEIANAAEVADILSTPAILQQLITGTIGAATIIIDITGAVAASPLDPIGWVLLKAVKSVWAGARTVQRSVSKVSGMLESLRRALQARRAEETRRRLPRARNPKYKL